jgi:hypothetical protein
MLEQILPPDEPTDASGVRRSTFADGANPIHKFLVQNPRALPGGLNLLAQLGRDLEKSTTHLTPKLQYLHFDCAQALAERSHVSRQLVESLHNNLESFNTFRQSILPRYPGANAKRAPAWRSMCSRCAGAATTIPSSRPVGKDVPPAGGTRSQ